MPRRSEAADEITLGLWLRGDKSAPGDTLEEITKEHLFYGGLGKLAIARTAFAARAPLEKVPYLMPIGPRSFAGANTLYDQSHAAGVYIDVLQCATHLQGDALAEIRDAIHEGDLFLNQLLRVVAGLPVDRTDNVAVEATYARSAGAIYVPRHGEPTIPVDEVQKAFYLG